MRKRLHVKVPHLKNKVTERLEVTSLIFIVFSFTQKVISLITDHYTLAGNHKSLNINSVQCAVKNVML